MFEFNVIFVYNTPKKTDCNKKKKARKKKAVICGKNVIGLNNVQLCDFIEKTVSQQLQDIAYLDMTGGGVILQVKQLQDIAHLLDMTGGDVILQVNSYMT